MKTARFRSLVLYILLGGFFVGLITFIIMFVTQGGAWAMRPSNAHMDGTSQLSNAGTIRDSSGTVLAQSVDGVRYYSDDYNIRCAMLHVLGDSNGYISTGVQSTSLTRLTGYNPVLGLNGQHSGDDMDLTVNAQLSSLAFQQLQGRNGAAVIYNYKTGEILCSVCTPTYDPSNVPSDLMENDIYEGVFLDKVLSSSFTPGSTFKVVTTACALQNLKDPDSWTYHCTGETVINGNTIVCDSHTAHGDETLQDALTNSCNCAYAELAVELGSAKMTKTAEQMGFNKNFTIDDNKTLASSYNVSGSTSDDELAWSGIGQHTDLANPIHMAILMGAIANDGTPVIPYTIQTAGGYAASLKTGARMMETGIARQLQTMMRNNVINGYGDSLFPDMQVCAKTGTGETQSDTPTGWIVGFSMNETTPYAFAVVVEEGGYGLQSAGTIASSLMTTAANLGL